MAPRIGGHDWSATPLGPAHGWPPVLTAAVDLSLGSPLGMIVLWGRELVQIYNDAYAAIMGTKHPAGLGQPTRECWPEVWQFSGPIYDQVFQGRASTFNDQMLLIEREGRTEKTWWDLTFSPIRDGGQVAGVLVTVFETTRRHIGDHNRETIEAALRASEARFRAFVVASSDVIYRMSPDWSEMRELDGRGFLADTHQPIQGWMERYIHPGDHDIVRTAADRAIQTKSMFELEHRVVRGDGTPGWTISRAVPILDNQGSISEWLGAATDVTDRREIDERRAFLLKLSDAIRPLAEPVAIQSAAARLLRLHLGANQVHFGETVADEGHEPTIGVRQGYGDGLLPMDGALNHLAEVWGERLLATYRAGCTAVCRDVETDPAIGAAERAVFTEAGVRAYVAVPLLKEGVWRAILAVYSIALRLWTANEIALIEEAAERTWAAIERASAEAALRESEERLRQFGEASQDVLWIRDAETLQLQYLTPAFESIYGLSRDEALRGNPLRRWAELIHPDDRDQALESMRRVREGKRVVFEYRVIRPSDGELRWVRNTDFPILNASGEVHRIGGIGHDATEEKRSSERIRLLASELQHRVRNTLAVVRSLIRRTAETSDTVDDFHMHLDGRVAAFARVQASVTRDPAGGIDLEALAAEELLAYAKPRGEQVSLSGPAIRLNAKVAENLGLAFHELATNAVKHGSLGEPRGRIRLTWQVMDGRLVIDWQESGVRTLPATPVRSGFGTFLLQSTLSYELDAEVRRTFGRGGLHCVIDVPLASIAVRQDRVEPAVTAALGGRP